jgi:multicomponent Na+:H+ antiporter subunit E
MIFVLAGLVLALLWTAITNDFTFGNLVLGGGVGFVALWLMRNQIVRPTLFRKFGRALALIGLFLSQLVLSATRVAILVVRPDMKRHLKPAIIAFPLSVQTDSEIALLANMITLTPGTLSVDVSNDKKTLFIHALSVPDRDALIAAIAGGFEAKIKEVFE